MFQSLPTPSLRAVLCACTLILLSVPARAQSSLAAIRGLVTDSQHAAVAGATVAARDKATGQRTVVKTNEAGLYSLTQLPIGSWVLTVEHQGFRTYVQDGITLSTGDLLGINIVLEVGVVSEKVTVTSETPLVQTRTSDLGQLINSQSVEQLPLGDRQALNIIKITGAAVFASYGKSATATPNFSLAGGRSQGQMSWIDGGSAQNMRLGVPQVDEDPPVESIEEIKVLSLTNSTVRCTNMFAITCSTRRGFSRRCRTAARPRPLSATTCSAGPSADRSATTRRSSFSISITAFAGKVRSPH